MIWTTDKPTYSGWWWVRDHKRCITEQVTEVFFSDTGSLFCPFGRVSAIEDAEWSSEPIPEPEERVVTPSNFDQQLFDQAPCYLCGYNGEMYYQPTKHPCAKLYHRHIEEQG